MASKDKAKNPKTTGKTHSARAKASTKSKKEILIGLLSRKSGADIASISKKLGWQNHTTRAALSRLRKSGIEITSEKSGNGKPSRYRITAGLPE